MYYQVIAFILLFPWVILAITVLGSLRSRHGRRGRVASMPPGGESAPRPAARQTHP
jgi:hypothetical protein